MESQNRESVIKESAEEWMLYLTARRDSNSGSNVVERKGSMETKADGEVQSKDLAFAARRLQMIAAIVVVYRG
jgi:hypothetical protein